MKNPNLWVRVFILSSGEPLAVGQVIGSSPISSTKKNTHPNGWVFFFWYGFFFLISSTHKLNRVSHPRRDILLLMFSIYARPVMQIQTKNSLCSVEAAQAEIFVN
jgi:hypothetical protein